jgi:hypothetical protein
LLHAANPINLANLICPWIRAALWANPSNLANPANPANLIYLPVCVAVWANVVNPAQEMLLHLANPVNPAMVTVTFAATSVTLE